MQPDPVRPRLRYRQSRRPEEEYIWRALGREHLDTKSRTRSSADVRNCELVTSTSFPEECGVRPQRVTAESVVGCKSRSAWPTRAPAAGARTPRSAAYPQITGLRHSAQGSSCPRSDLWVPTISSVEVMPPIRSWISPPSRSDLRRCVAPGDGTGARDWDVDNGDACSRERRGRWPL